MDINEIIQKSLEEFDPKSEVEFLVEELKTLTGASSIKTDPKKHGYDAAVGIVTKGDEILLGIATSDDDRFGKLCFPGGGIEGDEHPLDAAVRETREETGILGTPTNNKVISPKEKPGVAFVMLDFVGGDIAPNNEFSSLGWYPLNDLPWDKIYPQNVDMLKKLIGTDI